MIAFGTRTIGRVIPRALANRIGTAVPLTPCAIAIAALH
jgi:hypothetical protein